MTVLEQNYDAVNELTDIVSYYIHRINLKTSVGRDSETMALLAVNFQNYLLEAGIFIEPELDESENETTD